MQRGGHLAGCAGHTAVGHQRHGEAAALQRAQHRAQFVKLGHAVGARPLKAQHADHIVPQPARAVGFNQFVLIVEDAGGRFDAPVLGRNCRHFGDGAAQVAGEQPQSAICGKGFGRAAQHLGVAALRGGGPPAELACVQKRRARVARESRPGHGLHILVQQPRGEQFADGEGQPARGGKVIHIGVAVGIHAGNQRHRGAQFGEIRPVRLESRGAGHGHQVDGVIGRAAGGEQPHHAVYQRGFIQHAAHRGVVAAAGQLQHAARGFGGQRFAQRRSRIHEARAGQVQAHEFHQHLVGVGGAVEGAGAGAVVAGLLGAQQFGAVGAALRKCLAHLCLLPVRQSRGHRTRRHQNGRQVAEGQRGDAQPRHNLVANSEQQRAVEEIVGERNRRGLRNHIAAQQRKLHARPPLSHAVAHGGHAAGKLRHAAGFPRRALQQLGIAAEGLMRREHIVVGGDDGNVLRRAARQRVLVRTRTSGDAVGQIAARERAARLALCGAGNAVQVAPPPAPAAAADALGHGLNNGMQIGHGRLLKPPSEAPRERAAGRVARRSAALCARALLCGRSFPGPRSVPKRATPLRASRFP